jgi:hypothetical protein
LLIGLPGMASAQRAHNPVEAQRVVALFGWIQPGDSVWAETSNLSPGADTVLHVWEASEGVEIAFNDDMAPGTLASRVEYTNSTSDYLFVYLILRARSHETTGTADLSWGSDMSSSHTAYDQPVEGRMYDVSCTTSEDVIETARTPAGACETVLLAFPAAGQNLIGFDENGGVGKASRIEGVDSACRVMVGGTVCTGNDDYHAAVYVNDIWQDNDGDGLGFLLEEELGTCDDRSQPGCAECGSFGCATGQVFNLQDTDRDGLFDAWEVFGIDHGGWPQHLPAWGADPRRKDMFVEVDWEQSAFGYTNPLEPEQAMAVAAYFAEGKTSAVLNPNGEPGIAAHFDIGKVHTNEEEAKVFGSWGGANSTPSPDGNHWSFRDQYMNPVRFGVFRYAHALSGGSGQVPNQLPTDRLWFNANSSAAVQLLTHELGHTAGIYHHGVDEWGIRNCKPHYRSVMNYAYQNQPGMGFSDGSFANIVLNAAEANEMVLANQPWLEADPFRFSLIGEGVDWNRDGVLQASSIRGAITSGDAGCDPFTSLEQKLRDGDLGDGTPSIVRLRQNLYVFWTDSAGAIKYRRAALGLLSKGSCQNDLWGTECLEWSNEMEVPSAINARWISATNYQDDGVALAYVDASNLAVYTAHSSAVNPTGVVTQWATDVSTPSSVESWAEPEIAFINNGAPAKLYVFYVAGDATYRVIDSDVPGGAWSAPSTIVDDQWQLLEGFRSPSIAAMPTAAGIEQYCATFVDNQNTVRLYCLPDGMPPLLWVDRSDAFSATRKSAGKASMAFHVHRDSSGEFLGGDPANGYLHIIVNGGLSNDGHRKPLSVLVQRLAEASDPPLFQEVQRLHFGNAWMYLKGITSIALYDDPVLGATKAAAVNASDSLFFYPFADGTVRRELRDGSDFTVMERNVCEGVLSTYNQAFKDEVCGDPSSSVWGF